MGETTLHRRRFLELGLAGAGGALGGALLIPGWAAAADKTADPLTGPLAGAVYYTRKRPGRWSRYAAAHVPVFRRKGNALQVRTPHEMRGFQHYIVKHVLFGGNWRLLGEQIFEPDRDIAVSIYDITGMKGVVYALSVCNRHDAWLSGLKL